MNYIFGSLFGKNQEVANEDAVIRMQQEVAKLGGLLHFTIHRDTDGWSARCDEIPGLITGGKELDPSDTEIQSHIREAIHTAFHIQTKLQPEQIESKVSQMSVSFGAPRTTLVPC
ncbi:MAG: hypothetical protein KGH56_01685 [Patescibacteria group bacterium]|nr:hypothetical protein [Patescibacteria group bacterium]